MDEALDVVFDLVDRKRQLAKVLTDYDAKSLKNHLKNADKNNVKFCVCVGEDELSNQTVWVKDLETKEEKIINIAHF